MSEIINILKRYMTYRIKARSKFDLHSPFIYQIYSKILQDKTDFAGYHSINDLWARLIRDHRFLSRIDLGAKGADVRWQKKILSVSTISVRYSVSPKFGRLLFRLAGYFKPGTTLELGTSLGISTAYLAIGNPQGKVITIEGSPEIASEANKNFETLRLANIDLRIGNFDQLLSGILEELRIVDLVFVDGNHKKEATLNYFTQLLNHVHNQSVIVFDDIHWSQGMEEAWSLIKLNPKVKVSVDLFRMGIVFFREELSKEDYVIRF